MAAAADDGSGLLDDAHLSSVRLGGPTDSRLPPLRHAVLWAVRDAARAAGHSGTAPLLTSAFRARLLHLCDASVPEAVCVGPVAGEVGTTVANAGADDGANADDADVEPDDLAVAPSVGAASPYPDALTRWAVQHLEHTVSAVVLGFSPSCFAL